MNKSKKKANSQTFEININVDDLKDLPKLTFKDKASVSQSKSKSETNASKRKTPEDHENIEKTKI